MSDVWMVAAGTANQGAAEVEALEKRIHGLGFRLDRLVIDPLWAGWHTPLETGHFRSGCAPVEAADFARSRIASGEADGAVISGEDFLKTGYDRRERNRLMAIYGENCSLIDAYTALARSFIRRHGISEASFRELAGRLFENYERTFLKQNPSYTAMDARWLAPLSELFRGVDCANPSVDFSGQVIFLNNAAADACGISPEVRVKVAGTGLGMTKDGPDHTEKIVKYDHLKSAFNAAYQMAGVDFASAFFEKKALLEAYTCYPVVPLAFLLTSGMVASPDRISDFLEKYEITVSGGMNLAGAAWNNPALNALILMYRRLVAGPQHLGLVHGNGGLGYKQGVVILEKTL